MKKYRVKKLIAFSLAAMLVICNWQFVAFADDEASEAAAPDPAPAAQETPAQETQPAQETPAPEAKAEEAETSQQAAEPAEKAVEADKSQEADREEIKFSILGKDGERWVFQAEYQLGDKRDLKSVIDESFKDRDYKASYQDNGETLTGVKSTISARSLENDEEYSWHVSVNDREITDELSEVAIKGGDYILIQYAAEETALASVEQLLPLTIEVDSDIADSFKKAEETLLQEAGRSAVISSAASDMVFSLARSESSTLKITNEYVSALSKALGKSKSNKLNAANSLENAEVVLALASMGKDPEAFLGYNLISPLTDIEYVKAGGIEGTATSLLALNSHNYKVPDKAKEDCLKAICGMQQSDGRWKASSGGLDVSATAKAIQSLAPYYNSRADATDAIDKAVKWLKQQQNEDGGFSTSGPSNARETSQVITAMVSIGINPKNSWLKNGISPLSALDNLKSGKGFADISGEGYSREATAAAYAAMVAYNRFNNGQALLYDLRENSLEAVKAGEKDKDTAPAGRSITKSINLTLGDITEASSKTIDKIKEVNALKLPENPADYTEEQIQAITEAYKLYSDLEPAEKLAVEKDKSWKKYSEITGKLGKAYHYDKATETDLRDNDEEVLPWYIKLNVSQEDMTKAQAQSVMEALGEGSQIFDSYDITLINTLDGKKWEPDGVINVSLKTPEETADKLVVVHIGKSGRIDLLNCEKSEDGSSLNFKTTEFSLYGIAGSGSEIGDLLGAEHVNVLPWCLGGCAALALMILLMIIKRRMNREEE